MSEDLVTKVRAALADPKAPWYGSDVVPWVADLLDEIERLRSVLTQVRTECDVLKEDAEQYSANAAHFQDLLAKARNADWFEILGQAAKRDKLLHRVSIEELRCFHRAILAVFDRESKEKT